MLPVQQGSCAKFLSHSSPTFVVNAVKFLKPSDFDVWPNNINEKDLYLIGEMERTPYQNLSMVLPVFPVEGIIVMGMNKRYMVNLLVRRKNAQHFKNIVFSKNGNKKICFNTTNLIPIGIRFINMQWHDYNIYIITCVHSYFFLFSH